jgi:branched-chain amino acid transport system ATP-binding protein
VGAVAAVSAAPLLQTRGLARAFGGLTAVAGVDLSLAPGEIRALIGPNGAGKTTLVSLISGRLAPSAGRVVFDGRDVTALPPWQRVARGIAYTFQVTSVFRRLTVRDNVALAVQRRLMRGVRSRLALPARATAPRVEEVLARVGLSGAAGAVAGALPYGHQKLVEVAMALALEPRLLILDEPTQGLTPDEIGAFIALVREVAREATVLLIEHNMAVVLELASRITVMDKGAILAEGAPEEIEADPAVQRAYLGT